MPWRVAITQQAGFRKQRATGYSRDASDGNNGWQMSPSKKMAVRAFCNQCYLNLRRFENSRNVKFPGQGERRKRLERSETVERLERLDRAAVLPGAKRLQGLNCLNDWNQFHTKAKLVFHLVNKRNAELPTAIDSDQRSSRINKPFSSPRSTHWRCAV